MSEYIIGRVSSLEELARAFDVVGRQFDPTFDRHDRRFDDLASRFSEDRQLMLAVRQGDRLVGGAFGFRGDGGGMTVRAIALEPEARGCGLGRRLMETIEMEAMGLGVLTIGLGAGEEVRKFYRRLGYRGRRSTMTKMLPPQGRVRDLRLGRLRAAAGDLDAGRVLTPDPMTARVPRLFPDPG